MLFAHSPNFRKTESGWQQLVQGRWIAINRPSWLETRERAEALVERIKKEGGSPDEFVAFFSALEKWSLEPTSAVPISSVIGSYRANEWFCRAALELLERLQHDLQQSCEHSGAMSSLCRQGDKLGQVIVALREP